MLSDLDSRLQSWTRFHPKMIDLSLGRVLRLLNKLDNPHLHLPPTVHIAGTNGKGSVSAFLAAILKAAGYHCHQFISPHLLTFHERILLRAKPIDHASLLALIEEVEATNNLEEITYFEMTTALAFLAFVRTPADVLLLETGLGGEYDATNVIPKPVCSVITPIALDHQGFLGKTIAKIAKAKAGIIKHGTTVVSAAQSNEASDVIKQTAKANQASLLLGDEDWRWEQRDQSLLIRSKNVGKTPSLNLELPKPNLKGEFQFANAALACMASQTLGLKIPDKALGGGITSATIQARLHHLKLPELPATWRIVCDGGHNPHAAQAIARWLAEQNVHYRWLVFASLNTKDWQESLASFKGICQHIWSIPIKTHAEAISSTCVAPDEVARHADHLQFSFEQAPDLQVWSRQFNQKILRHPVHERGIVLFFGSLYLASQVLSSSNPRFLTSQ